MKLKNAMPVLFVKDAPAARDFYAGLLGMEVVSDFDGLNFVFREGFALWQIMEGNIIPETLGMERITDSAATARFELCFETGDIDKVYAKLKRNGVRFLHEINTELWGQRTIRFYDPDGHLIEVGEEMQVFLRRVLEEEGGNVVTAAQRTFMTPELFRQYLGM